MAGCPSTSTHSFDIWTWIVAHHDLSEAPKLIFTRDTLRRCRYVAVAQIWTYGEGKFGIAWNLRITT